MSTDNTDTSLFKGNLSNSYSNVEVTDLNPNVVQSLNYTQHSTPEDAEVYPGTLNKDNAITAFSTEDDIQNSAVNSAHDMGVLHYTELQPEYNNPEFPKDLFAAVDSSGAPGVTPDRKILLAKLISKIQDESFTADDLVQLNGPIDIKSFLPELGSLSLIGDPRWSLGAAIQAMLQEFIPRTNAYLKSISPDAVSVNSIGEICDADGNPIDTSKLFNMGVGSVVSQAAPTVPPPTAKEFKVFFKESAEKAFKRHADAFVRWLKKNYLDIEPKVISTYPNKYLIAMPWKAQPVFLSFAGFFFIKLTQEIIEKDPPQIAVRRYSTDGDGRKMVSGYDYEYLYGYKEESEREHYNPEGVPDREDPDAPAPPGSDDEEDPLPPGKPGMIEVYDRNIQCKRYYQDQKEYIAEQLGVEITNANNIIGDRRNILAFASLSDPIPDYTVMYEEN
jgi:hypothetical protein